MNEQAIQDAYDLFVGQGYSKGINDFRTLLSSNPQALDDAFGLFKSNGYTKTVDDFKTLMGVSASAEPLKKNESQVSGQAQTQPTQNQTQTQPAQQDATALPLAGSSQVSPSQTNVPTTVTRSTSAGTSKVEFPAGLTTEPTAAPTVEPKTAEQLNAEQRFSYMGKTSTEAADKYIKEKEKPKEEEVSYLENLWTNLGLGASYVNQGVASIPESVINILAIPQNFIAEKTGWNIGTNADKIKEQLGITNPILDWVKEEQKVLNGEVSKYISKNYEDPSIVNNFSNGEYQAGFELLGSSIAQSLPLSLAMMVGGAYTSPEMLAAATTVGLTDAQRDDLEDMDPTMSESEKTIKALGMSAAESVFSAIGEGTIGKVYRDIAKKEGKEAAKNILKDGLVKVYKTALEKGGAPVGLIGEGLEEAATQITQNVIAGKSTFEGAADAFASGAGSGVVFTAPISAINAKKYIKNKIETYDTKDKIGKILIDGADEIHNLYNVSVSSDITPEQLEIANLNKSRDILVNNLKKNVKNGTITEDDAKQSLYVFDKVSQVSNAIKDLDVSLEDKATIATLLRQREELKSKIENKDDVLVIREKQQIEDINSKINEIVLKPKEEATPEAEAVAVTETPEQTQKRDDRISLIESMIAGDNVSIAETGTGKLIPEARTDLQTELETLKQERDAIQKPTTEKSVLRTEQLEVGLPKVGEGDKGQVTAQAGVAPAETVIEVKLPEIEVLTETEKQDIADRVSALTPEQINEEATKLEELLKQQGQEPQFKMADMSEPELVDLITTVEQNRANLLKKAEATNGTELTLDNGQKAKVDVVASISVWYSRPKYENSITASIKDDAGNSIGTISFDVNSVDGTISPSTIFMETSAPADAGVMKNLHKAMSDNGFVIRENTMEEVRSSDEKSKAELKEAIVSSKTPTADFKKQKSTTSADEVNDIVDAINAIESPNVSTNLQPDTKQPSLNVSELNERTDTPMQTVSIDVVNGVPVLFTISDQLTTGNVTNPFTKKVINFLKGGLGFNGTKGNQVNAWANVNEQRATDMKNKAVQLYNQNKKVFEDFWKKYPQYNGLVPTMVVKMGEGSILSNEATFRVLADNIAKFPLSNRKKALKVLINEIKTEISEKEKAISELANPLTKRNYQKEVDGMKQILDIIQKSKPTLIDDIISPNFIAAISNLDTRRTLIEIIAYGQPNNAGEKKKANPPKTAVPLAILGFDKTTPVKEVKTKDFASLNLANIVDVITDPQMRDVEQRQIVAIVGVDVLNPGVVKVDHPNYPFGVRGKSIGVLEKPVPLQQAYASAYNLALKGLIKEEVKAEKKGKAKPASVGNILTQKLGVQNGLTALDFFGAVSNGDVTNTQKLISFMNNAFPSVMISTDKETFNNVMNSDGVRKFLKGGEVVYGVTVDGDIYINPDVHNSESELFNTSIHEFGHVWTDNLLTTEKGKEIYNKGVDLIKQGTKSDPKLKSLYDEQLKKFNGDESKAMREIVAILIGNKGETITNASIKSKFNEWLLGMWKYISTTFKMSKDITADDLQNLTLDQFIGTALADIFSGKSIEPSKVKGKKLKNPEAAFRSNQSIESIIKTGLANGFSDESIVRVLENRGFTADEISNAMKENKKAASKVEVSEETLPGYNAVMEKISGIVAKVIGRVRNESDREAARQRAFDDAMAYLQGSKIYEDATDVQREMLVRDIRDRFYEKEKKAPSVARLLGQIKDVKKVTMTEKSALKKQIMDLARGARDAKKAIADATRQLSEAMDNLVKEGKLTANQARILVKKFASVNVLSPKSVGRFVDYATKVFEKADYAERLSQARDTKKAIAKLSKNKEKNADLRDLGTKFLEIDPSMVEDIDAYNEMALKVKEAIKGSTIRGQKVNFAQTVNIEDTTKYVNDVLETQRKQLYDERVEEIKEMMGIDAEGLSYEDMIGLLEPGKPVTKYNEGIIRSTINKAFNTYSSIIKDMLSTGKDSFTGDDVSFSSSEKELINKFMGMDLSKLTPKQALEAVDALSNFIENKSIAKMGSVIADYNGKINAQEIVDRGISAKPLQMYWSRGIGKFMAEQFASLPLLIEKMFKGVKAGAIIERASGLMSLKNNKAAAERQSNNTVTEYIDKFYKTKANGEEFNSEANLVERGLVSFMTRNIIGTDAQMKAEFDRRKKLIEQSIDALSNGNDVEKKKAELYQAAYDKLLKDANNTREVTSKADPNNLKAVMFWQEKWSDIYDKLSDVSLGIYNRRLGKDINYTPDRFSRLKTAKEKTELSNLESLFYGNTNSLYKKEAGVIMEAERPDNLPSDPDNGNPNMYIDLSFDKNNANSYYDALVDMNTASDVRQIESFINSEAFSKIVPNEDDRNILKERIQLYVRNIRGKNILESDQMNEAIRKLNTLSAIGVGQALGGITQPIKQTIPVAINTIMNAGNLKVNALFDKGMNEFMNKSGYAIANRGLESQAQIDSINKLIDLASKSDGIKALKYIENANKMWLDIFLVKPDVAIARSSWMTYYEKALKQQGIDTDNIDYSTHELNKDAADYAQSMVDRQQNVSDKDLQGKLFSSKEPVRQMFVKAVMPFANFRMNQTMRMTSDVSVLTSKTSSKEDKVIAARSLSGFAAEMFTFKMIASGSAILLGSLAKEIMGKDEDDEDKDKRINNIIKGQATSTLTDMISPVPFLDKPIAAGASAALELTQDFMDIPADEQLSIYGSTKSDFISSLGTFGIAADRASKLYDITKLASTGEYTDDYGVTRKISDEDADALAPLIGASLLTNVGLAPTEVNSVVNYAVKDAKRDAKSVSEKEHKAKKYKEEKVKEIKLKKGEFGYQKPSEKFGGKGFGSKTFGGK